MGILMDKVELLGTLLEAILYGFSLLMFVGSIWSLLYRRSTNSVNRGMLMVAILLLLLSTAHMVVHIIRLMSGLVLYRDTYPGGPVRYFTNGAEWTYHIKNRIFLVQMLLGDAVIIFRCYVIWRSKLVVMFPVLLWCAVAVTGYMATGTEQRSPGLFIFDAPMKKWILANKLLALSTTLSATLLLVFRIWNTDRKVNREGIRHSTHLQQVIRITIDAGAIYSLTCLTGLICFLTQSNGQNIVIDIMPSLIAMMFYMVIIRVGLITWGQHGSFVTTETDRSIDQRHNMQVRITKLMESKTDRHQPSSRVAHMVGSETSDNNASSSEIQFDGKREEV